mgnify:FL=1
MRTAWKIEDIAKYAHLGDKFSKMGTAKHGDEYDAKTWEILIVSAVMDKLEAEGRL